MVDQFECCYRFFDLLPAIIIGEAEQKLINSASSLFKREIVINFTYEAKKKKK